MVSGGVKTSRVKIRVRTGRNRVKKTRLKVEDDAERHVVFGGRRLSFLKNDMSFYLASKNDMSFSRVVWFCRLEKRRVVFLSSKNDMSFILTVFQCRFAKTTCRFSLAQKRLVVFDCETAALPSDKRHVV